jgi:hypothetical protein
LIVDHRGGVAVVDEPVPLDEHAHPWPLAPVGVFRIDGLHGVSHHLAQRVDFAVIAKAPLPKLRAWARHRGWAGLRLLSSHDSTFNLDLGARSPYWRYEDVRDPLCGAHPPREPEGVAEEPGQGWAASMAELLLDVKPVADRARIVGADGVDEQARARWTRTGAQDSWRSGHLSV